MLFRSLIEAGSKIHRKLRARLRQILAEGAAERTLIEPHLHPLGSLDMCVPLSPPDFADFYASYHHAIRSAAAMRREPVEDAPSNWNAMPLGYHARSGTVTGPNAENRRPKGDRQSPLLNSSSS